MKDLGEKIQKSKLDFSQAYFKGNKKYQLRILTSLVNMKTSTGRKIYL